MLDGTIRVRRWRQAPHEVEVDRTGRGDWNLVYSAGDERIAAQGSDRLRELFGEGRRRVRPTRPPTPRTAA